ncbi:MAG: hypothetical protein ABR607_05510 [Pyrinomonadaceae bacterium]
MITKTYSTLLVLAFITSALVISFIHGRIGKTQVSQPSSAAGQVEVNAPIADFNSPEETDPAQRAKRLLKNKRHNLRDKNLSPDDRARFVLREEKSSRGVQRSRQGPTPLVVTAKINHDYNPPVIGGAVGEESAAELALPTYNSDAVVLGYVTDASAYLSEDKTSVYSEFGFQISQILKNSRTSVLDGTSTVTVLRPGGGVRFPSGTVRYFLVGGRGLPRAGKRYLLFLKYDDLAQSFYIVTGYELREGRVFPLDSIPPGGTAGHQFASYSKYDGAAESQFLTDVEDAILHPIVPPTTSFPISQTTPNQESKQ